MFGGLPGSTTRFTPVHGVWERTSWSSIGGTSLFLVFDASTGVLTGFRRARCSLTFANDFNSYEGLEFIENISCESPLVCPDPLDRATSWTPLSNMPPGGFPVSGSRLEWIPAGPLN
jgi:hypothetical protein